jgi:4-hydroxybenzoate polyprenyltransferase
MSFTSTRAYLQLIRFPLIFTSWSDVLAGYFLVTMGPAASGAGPAAVPDASRVAVMLGATAFLCAGGMTLSDSFDYGADKEHGHARPLPVGLLSAHAGFTVGIIMILLAIASATVVSATTGLMSVAVALLLVMFASLTSGMPVLGAVNVSLSRGVNVIFGMAFAVGDAGPLVPKPELWAPVAALVGYIFLVTQIASEEGRANRERLLRLTGALIVVLVVLNVLLYILHPSNARIELRVLLSVAVLAVVLRLLQLARRVARELSTESVQKLVVAGFVGAIVLNANFVAFTGAVGATIGILFLIAPTFLLLRFFHVLFPGTRTAID